MTGLQVLITIAAAWLLVVVLIRLTLMPVLRKGPDNDPVLGLVWWVVRGVTRTIHSPRYTGLAELRDRVDAGPLVIVSNHTGSIDPFLIQSGARFAIRWMMATEQMFGGLDWMWRLLRLIPVARDGRDATAAREAIRHVRAGGVVGIFPEGRVVTPPGRVWPFLAGVGLIIARSKAPVMLVWVSETPPIYSVSGSLFTSSRSRIEYDGPIDYTDVRDPEAITADLRRRLHEISGWPIVDETAPPPVRDTGPELG